MSGLSDGLEGFKDLLIARRSVREYDRHRAVQFQNVERIIWSIQGRTSKDGLRTAPSAHALHPLRLYLVAGNVEPLNPGLYAISHSDGSLDLSREGDLRQALQQAALDDQPWIGNAACILVICADLVTPTRDFAEQPPYGTRGLRYVYMEAGAAAQNALLQTVDLGLGGVLVAGFDDDAMGKILGLPDGIAPVIQIPLGYPAE